MQKLIWGAAALAAAGVGYWWVGGESCATRCPCSPVPTECGTCEPLPTPAAEQMVEVIDLSPVYETKPTEDEPPLAEFDPRAVEIFQVPAPFPLHRELAAMEKMPLIGTGEEESEAFEAAELLPMPTEACEVLHMPAECAEECDGGCCVFQALYAKMKRFVSVKVDVECDESSGVCPHCPATAGQRHGSVTVKIGLGTGTAAKTKCKGACATGEEEQTEPFERLPMPRRLSDTGTMSPGKPPKVDTMEVRPADVPGLSVYPFPY